MLRKGGTIRFLYRTTCCNIIIIIIIKIGIVIDDDDRGWKGACVSRYFRWSDLFASMPNEKK